MRKILIIVLLLAFVFSANSQSISINFSHEVTYTISNRQKTDSISVAFDKSGRYLWTKHEVLAKELYKEFLKHMKLEIEEFDSNIIFDSESGKIYVNLTIEDIQLFIDFNIAHLLPSSPRDAISETIILNAERTQTSFKLGNKEYPVYKLIPNVEKGKFIEAAFDLSSGIDMSLIFKRIISIILTQTNSEGSLDLNIPAGLLLSISDEKGRPVIQAIASKPVDKKISIKHSFNISE